MTHKPWGAVLDSILMAAWLGGATLFAAVVAPVAFAVVPSRAIAGNVIGGILPVVYYSGITIALVSVALTWNGTASPSTWWRRASAGVIIVTSAAAQFFVGARIARVRAGIPGAVDALAPDDPRRVLFGRLHTISVGCLGIAMLAALLSIALATRSPVAGPSR